MTSNHRPVARFAESYEIATQSWQFLQNPAPTLRQRLNQVRRRLRYQFLPHYFGKPPRWRMYIRKLSKKRVYPNFACIGPIKSGTSDFANYLFEHPCVIPPFVKEVRETTSGQWLPFYPTEAEFTRVAQELGVALTGYSVSLIHRVALLEELARVSPNCKVIILLRDPVDRAYSHYKWDLFLGGFRMKGHPHSELYRDFTRSFNHYVKTSLELFPATEMPSALGQMVLPTGIYHSSVDRWIRRFGTGNVMVLESERFFRNPAAAVNACFEFLGVDPIEVQVHTVLNRNPINAPPPDLESIELLREFYHPYNQRLYELLGRDLGWQ